MATPGDNTVLHSRHRAICEAFQQAWRENKTPEIEAFLQSAGEADSEALFRQLLQLDMKFRSGGEDSPTIAAADYVAKFPQFETVVNDVFAETVADIPRNAASIEDTVALTQVKRGAAKPVEDFIGQYELLAEIGRGGMGVVYKARHEALKRVVALKVIKSGEHAHPQEIARFEAEAEAVAQLNHPGIVTIYEVGREAGRNYFSMEFVEGESLSARIAKGPLEGRIAAELCAGVCDAVACAHENGIVHRDLKPANVLLDSRDQPRVTDFGLAKQLDADSEITATGQILGTPSYMPPEQARGDASQIGPLADVYSIGATLYAMLTGRPPFRSSSPMETIFQVLQGDLIFPRRLDAKIPIDLETICVKCLEKDPSRRYQSAAEVAAELRRFLADEPIRARRIGPLARFWRLCRRYPVVSSLYALVLITLMAGVGVSSYFAVLASQRATLLESAIEDEKQAKQAAQKQGKIALDTLETVVFHVDQELEGLPGSTAVRKRILNKVLEELDQVAAKSRGNVDLNKGIVHFQFAQMLRNVSEGDAGENSRAATEQFEASLQLLQSVNDSDAADDYSRLMQAVVRGNLGDHLNRIGELKEGAEQLQIALESCRELAERHADEERYTGGLAVTLQWWAESLISQNKWREAKAAFEEAKQVSTPMYEKWGDRIDVAVIHNTSLSGLADCLNELGEPKKAEAMYEEVLAIDHAMAEAAPLAINILTGMSITYERLGNLRIDRDDRAGAEEAYLKSIEACRKAVALDANNLEARLGLAYERDLIAREIYVPTARYAEARAALEEAAAIYSEVVAADSGDEVTRRDLAHTQDLLKRIP